MALAAFDTHTFVKRLTKAGMPVEQAEVLSEEQARLVNGRLATKDDLALLGKDLRREIGDLRKDMDAKHESLRHEIGDLRKDMEAKFAGVDAKLEKAKFDLLKWMVGLAVGNFAFLVGIFWKVMSIPGIH